jgi:ubiquinone/menaquinone biosynthesis C-methylase UbiE
MPSAEGFNEILRVVARSAAFREAMVRGAGDDALPEWATPYSLIGVRDLSEIADYLSIGPGDTFADLACGLGGPGLWLAERTGAMLVGIDWASGAINVATELAEDRGLDRRTKFVVADMTATGQTDASFDAVVSIDALQFADVAAATAEIARIVKPGGRIAVTTWHGMKPDSPGLVADYRPYFKLYGLDVERYEEPTGWRERHIAQFASVLERRSRIVAELGAPAHRILDEAEAAPEMLKRFRRVIILARRPLT